MEALLDPAVKRRVKSPPRAGPPGLRLTPADLETYLDSLSQQGRGRDTLATYRRNVHALYDELPEDKTVRPGTLDRWREALLEGGYSPRTVNVRISVANSLMAFLGRTAVTDSMKQLCRDARVAEEKANPRCLKHLWQTTQDGFRAQLDRLVEQAWDCLLETEQLSIGWNSSKGVRGP